MSLIVSKNNELIVFSIEKNKRSISDLSNNIKQKQTDRSNKNELIVELSNKIVENKSSGLSKIKQTVILSKTLSYLVLAYVCYYIYTGFAGNNQHSLTDIAITCFFSALIFFGIAFYETKTIKSANELILSNNNINGEIEFYKKEVSNLTSNIKNIETTISKKELLLKSLYIASDFSKNYEVYNINNDLDLLINENQQKIDNQYLINIVRLRTYIDKRQDIYKTSISNFGNYMKSAENSDDVDIFLSYVIENEASLKKCYLLATKMVEFYTKGNMVDFFKIYNGFEEMGLFSSAAEKKLISSINDLNSNIENGFRNLINKISDLEYSISDSLYSIESSLSNVDSSLSNIDNKLD